MKIMTIFGTRPEIIRLSVIIKRLDRFCEQILVHTGQNYDKHLSDIFFAELDLRAPDLYLGVRAETFADQVGQILVGVDKAMEQFNPDRILILGDTNSGLSSIVAARRSIPVFHLEAGNRCYDDRVPEEVNRRIIDHSSTILMPYTHRSKENLLREGIERDRIFVIGNPIYEVINTYEEEIQGSGILLNLGLEPRNYLLVTMHRAENVDAPDRLGRLSEGLAQTQKRCQVPMIVSLHPRTADKLRRFGLRIGSEQIRLVKPLGFFDFVRLERDALCVISDSGTVQEECCLFGVPNITIRDVTERAETIECGSNILTGADTRTIANALGLVLNCPTEWKPPSEYVERHVSTAVAKIILGHTSFRARS